MQVDALLEEIQNNYQMAREHAYLGQYERAIEQYNNLLPQIQHQEKMATDTYLQKQWRLLAQEAKRELNLSKELYELIFLDSFPQKQEENNQYLREELYQRQEQPDVKRNTNSERFLNKENKDNKDPDVWDAPKSKPKPVARAPVKAAPQQKNNIVDKAAMGKQNYDKPWKKNARNPEKESQKEQDKADKPKTYLEHVYPDGKGPDADLVAGLEKEIVQKNLSITFDDIAELENAKQALEEAILWPLKFPELFTGIRRPWKGVLLYGPPGTGKTLLAKAIASTGATTFFNISAANLASKWRGESEKMVRILFEMARFYAPSTIFFDEIDALTSQRSEGEHESSRKVKTELLQQIDGFQSVGEDGEKQKVTIIAATNIPWGLDTAMLRRLEKRIYVPLPGPTGLQKLYEINLKNIVVDPNIEWSSIYQKSEFYSGADIANVVKEASFLPIRRMIMAKGGVKNANAELQAEIKQTALTQSDFEESIKNIPKSVKASDLVAYDEWINELTKNGQ